MATITSKQFSLNLRDFLHGAFVAVATAVLPPIYEVVTTGNLDIDWKRIGGFAIAGFVGYLIKKFVEPAKIVMSPASEEQVKAIRSGEATVEVVNK